ncbi:unnamed protein product, partial [Closterium sp. NIES-53]
APPIFAGCAAPQLPTFTATRASATVSVVEDTAAVSATDWQKRGKSGKKGGKGGGGGGGGGGGAGSGGGGGGGGGAPGGGSLGGGAGQTGPPTGGVQTSGGVGPYPCVCGRDNHSAARCFRRLDDLYRARWGPEATTPCWARLLARKIHVFDLSMDDAHQYALYADVDFSADGSVCSRVGRLACLHPASVDLCLSSLGVCLFALGACVASTPGSPHAVASLSFTMDSGASQCFFRDHTTLTPLLAPVQVALADPSSGPVVAHSSTTLSCPVVPSGVLRSLHIPSFTRNLVGVGYLQDKGITVTFVGGGRNAVCTDAVTGRVLASFTREPRSSLYVLHTEHSLVSTSPQKSEVTSTLIRWLLATEGTRGRRVSCLHSDRGGEFCSGILARFCGEQGIVQSWMLPESPQQNGVAERRIDLVMDIARTSMIHAHAPHFLWRYAVFYAAHQLNLQPRISRLEASLTSIWTGSPGVGSAFCVKGCLAFVRDTSADKLSARAVPCVFLGFPVASAKWSFYHPPLHQFLDSRDVRFDESVSYYTWYPCRGLSVPPPPFFLAPSLPPAPAPPIPPPPSGLAPSGVSHATPLPSVACQIASPSPQSSSVACQVTVDSVGVGAGGAATGGTRSGGARSRGVGAGGAGTGGASYGGAGAGGAGTGGARRGGAGAGDPDPVGTSSGDIGSGGASGLSACARQLDLLEQQQQRQQQQQPLPPPQQLPLERQLFPPVSGLRALGLPSSPLVRPPSLPAFVPTFFPPDARPAVWSSPPPQSPPPVVRHHRSRPCPPSACPSSPITDLHTALLCTSLHRSPPPVSVLPSPPPSSLPVSPTPISDNYRIIRLIVSRVLATGVTDPRFSPSSVSTLTAVVADFGAASRLDYSTRVVPAPPTHPLSVGGEFALGCDVLEDRHSKLEYLAAASPTL